MRRFLEYINRFFFLGVIGIIFMYMLLYITLSVPFVQKKIRDIAVYELEKIVETRIELEKVDIKPFNKISLNNLTIYDQAGDTLTYMNKLSLGLELHRLFRGELCFSSIHLSKFDINLNRENQNDDLNIRFITDLFSKKEKSDSSILSYQIKSVFIRQGNFRYDVKGIKENKNKFDKNHINISGINSTVFLNEISSDTIDVKVKRVSFSESKGFSLKNLSLTLHSDFKTFDFSDMKIRIKESEFDFDKLSFSLNNKNDFSNFLDSCHVDIDLKGKNILLSEAASFVPAFKNFRLPLELRIKSDGYINDLSVSHINLVSENNINIKGNAYLNDINKGFDAYIFGQLVNCNFSQRGINSIASGFIKDEKSLNIVNELGNIDFNGEISGFFNNLVAYGKLSSCLGSVNTDILLGKNDSLINCNGSLKTENFRLGQLLSNKNLGEISTSITVDIQHDIKRKAVSGDIDCIIPEVDLKGYNYNNIICKGHIENKEFDGSLYINDPNGNLYVDGNIRFDKANSIFRFTAKADEISLDKLNLVPKYNNTYLSFNIESDFTGNNFDNAQGRISIDSLRFYNDKDSLFLANIDISALNKEQPQALRINSEILTAQIVGDYSFSTLPNSVAGLLKNTFPFIDKRDKRKFRSVNNNDFEFFIRLGQFNNLCKLLHLPLSAENEISINGYYNDDTEDSNLILVADIPDFKYNKTRIKDTSLSLKMPRKRFSLTGSTNLLNKHDKPLNISFNSISKGSDINTKIEWTNFEQNQYKGSLLAGTSFEKREGKYPIKTSIEIIPSDIIVNDSVWKIKESVTVIDSSRIKIDDMRIYNNHQALKINGTLSSDFRDTLSVDINDINLDYIFDIINMDFIMFGGDGLGRVNLFNDPDLGFLVRTDSLKVENFTYNDEKMGDLVISSLINISDMDIFLDGNINSKGHESKIHGNIMPKKDSLYLSFNTDRLNAGFVKIWTDNILQNIKGSANADMALYGKFRELNLVGKAWSDDLSFGIEYLNTRYRISDTIVFTENGIDINHIKVFDTHNGLAYANGSVNYKNFKDFKYNLTFNIPTSNTFLLFDVNENINSPYWGTIFGAGNAHIYGDVKETKIDVNGVTKGNSKFFFALNDNISAGDYQFITFNDITQRDSVDVCIIPKNHLTEVHQEKHNLYITIQVDATPDATVNLIMDSSSGDAIKGNGSGNIRLEYNNVDDFKLFGNYNINRGSYNFNFQDIFAREFIIKEGSSVEFHGDPFNTQLDINAYYQVTANLSDLDETIGDSKEISRTNVPVQCMLNINGDLWQPDLDFDINLPTVSQDIDRRVKSIIGTQEMMNKQIIYLLVLNKFYTPDYVSQNQQNRYSELSSVASSTLSSQLNNLLGQLSDNWNIGTNIRTDKGDFSDVEVQLALSSQLLNNRLLFNGNLGYKDNQNTNNTNSFIGDFDLEYLLNPIGTLRLKAYNHYNDRNYSIKSALTTQGVGVMAKKDFNSISDLFSVFINRNRKRKPVVKEEPLQTSK